MANVYETVLPYADEADISAAMDAALPGYRNAKVGEVSGGVLTCTAPKFVHVHNDQPLAEAMPCADHLMNLMESRMPK